MKKMSKYNHGIFLFFLAVFVLLFQSCIMYNPYNYQGRYNSYQQPSVPVSDIIQMSKDSVSSKDIITEIRRSHTVYLLKADQLAKLKDEGVQDSVINYMEKTHIDAVRRNQMMQDSYYGWTGMDGYMYGGYGYGWPFAYWGWGLGWDIGTAILFHGHGGYGHGFRGVSRGGSIRGASRR
jgi:hypothetical protein